jgi:F-type H+-transporting ATPase subunit delta
MLKGAIARRYAGAIFELAQRQNAIDRTLEDIKGIAQVFAHRKLAYLLQEPKVSAQRKEAALRDALTSKVLPMSLNLALLVVQRGLVELMPHIAIELERLVLDYYNQAIAQVTTAAELDQDQSDLVKGSLERTTGKNIIMHTRTDPNILGGLIVRVGDQVIDSSVRYRLQVLQQELLAGVATDKIGNFSPDEGLALVDTSV